MTGELPTNVPHKPFPKPAPKVTRITSARMTTAERLQRHVLLVQHAKTAVHTCDESLPCITCERQ